MEPDLFTYSERYPNSPGHRGVDTSIEAAKRIKPRVPALHSLMIRHIGLGATNDELSAATGIKNSTVSGRLREMVLLGKIYASDERRAGKSGVKQIVWKVV